MEILKNFVVFEGCDGSGTTTQLTTLGEFFQENQGKLSLPSLYLTFEPTDGSIGRLIRSALQKNITLEPETIALLFAADRNEHISGSNGIAERCSMGELVVSDRYIPSSLVYQGITCGEALPLMLNQSFPCPELLIFFDIDPETAQKRMENRSEKEIYEYLDFQIQVRERYKSLLPGFSGRGVRVETIDASLPPDEVASEVWRLIRELPIIKK